MADRDAAGEERRTNLSYRKRKMVIKHDEEMARNKMEVDFCCGKRQNGDLKKEATASYRMGMRTETKCHVNVKKALNSGAEK